MNNTERQAWLDSLKVGDEVCYLAAVSNDMRIRAVTGRTKTGRIKVNGSTWNADGSARSGDSILSPGILRPVTQGIRDRVELSTLQKWLHNIVWNTYPLSKLRQIRAILEGEES